jgi:hypothetical protein
MLIKNTFPSVAIGGHNPALLRQVESPRSLTGHARYVAKALTGLMFIVMFAGAIYTTPALASTKISLTAAAVTASGNDGNIPSNTVDGNLATRWSAQGSGVWIQYNLGSCQAIDYARLAWHQGDSRKSTFSVSVSKDGGASWTQVLGNTQSSGTTASFETVQLSDPAANAVRIFGYGNTVNNWTSLSEVELYSLGASTACSTGGGGTGGTSTKLAIPAANVTASADDGNVPSNTVDNNLATRWSAQGSGVWIQYKLGSCQMIDYARLAWYQGDTRKTTFSMSISKDSGTTWTQILGNMQSSGTTTAFETVQLPDTAANMVRIFGYGNTSSAWTSLAETELYTAGAATSCSTGTGTGTANYPADVFAGLKTWKLTLPTSSNNAQYPATEVKQPTLGTYSSTYFKLNTNKDSVLLTSLFGGATTSSGTAYARTELREMKSDGTTNAAWSCSSGVRKMHIRQRIVKTPIHKPEMSVGQIHDDSNDVLEIHFTGPEDSSGVGTGNGVGTGVLRAHWNNDTSQDTLDSAYIVGDIMVVDIDTSSNTMRVNYRNERTGVTTTKTKTFSGIVGSCYFKAGNYHQGCSKTNIYGGTNQSCVDKGWTSAKYETDPFGTSVLEMFELTMPY